MSLPRGSFCRSWQEQLFGLGGVPEADAAGHEVADRHSGEEAASQTQWPVPAPCCSSTQPGRWWRSDAITRRQSETRKKMRSDQLDERRSCSAPAGRGGQRTSWPEHRIPLTSDLRTRPRIQAAWHRDVAGRHRPVDRQGPRPGQGSPSQPRVHRLPQAARRRLPGSTRRST